MSTAECQHYADDWGNNQVGHALDAERRMANGEKQRKCRVCGLYVWDTMWFPKAAT